MRPCAAWGWHRGIRSVSCSDTWGHRLCCMRPCAARGWRWLSHELLCAARVRRRCCSVALASASHTRASFAKLCPHVFMPLIDLVGAELSARTHCAEHAPRFQNVGCRGWFEAHGVCVFSGFEMFTARHFKFQANMWTSFCVHKPISVLLMRTWVVLRHFGALRVRENSGDTRDCLEQNLELIFVNVAVWAQLNEAREVGAWVAVTEFSLPRASVATSQIRQFHLRCQGLARLRHADSHCQASEKSHCQGLARVRDVDSPCCP